MAFGEEITEAGNEFQKRITRHAKKWFLVSYLEEGTTD